MERMGGLAGIVFGGTGLRGRRGGSSGRGEEKKGAENDAEKDAEKEARKEGDHVEQ